MRILIYYFYNNRKDVECMEQDRKREILNLQKQQKEKRGYYIHSVILENGYVDIHSHTLKDYNHPDLRIKCTKLCRDIVYSIIMDLCDSIINGAKYYHTTRVDMKFDGMKYSAVFRNATEDLSLFDNDVLDVSVRFEI